jgi:acetolactate synthase-1/2/3 large subunit
MLSMLNVPIADDDPEDLAMKTSDLLVQCLENEGVEYVFGIPGEENLDFLESLRESKIELIPTRHEQAAG